MLIFNLTQHDATLEQVREGVRESFGWNGRQRIKRLLTFNELPDNGTIDLRARALANIAKESGLTHAMIGGAPFLMAPLEHALRRQGITPVYAFSVRESVEKRNPDGTVEKVSSFRHMGFVTAWYENYQNRYV